jgi:hypothetical protein
MISYIIPTLWKSENIHKTIERFCEIEDDKAELIIINNSNLKYLNSDFRVKNFKMPKNIYVNPSWNLGVHSAINNKVCLVNDDILFDIKKFHYFALDSKAVAIGINNNDRCSVDSTLYQLREIHDRNARPSGLGQLMLIEKQNWISLPDDMKIYYGDDIIYYYHTLILDIPFHYIKGMALNGDQSVTVNTLPNHMNKPFSQDTLEYHKMMHTLGLNSCTVFPMELKRAWKYEDIDQKITFEKLMNNIINNE